MIDEEVLALRELGMTIYMIQKITNYSLTEICEIIYAQNERDKLLDDD